MIETIETKKLHSCDICKRRIPKPIKKCNLCGKEICQYCRIKLTTTIRKYPDSGYITYQKGLGYLCMPCASKNKILKDGN